MISPLCASIAHDPTKPSLPTADIESRGEAASCDASYHNWIEYVRARVVTVLTQRSNSRRR
jgi:hypothetical protein